ncbi:actin maturation protease-like [Branchiostoma lanceolatum]|uniref:actin maturation protease-like n=1 Tax=Branchiostoma lanceolatum TaxID=7740 RepID=UPI003451DB2C
MLSISGDSFGTVGAAEMSTADAESMDGCPVSPPPPPPPPPGTVPPPLSPVHQNQECSGADTVNESEQVSPPPPLLFMNGDCSSPPIPPPPPPLGQMPPPPKHFEYRNGALRLARSGPQAGAPDTDIRRHIRHLVERCRLETTLSSGQNLIWLSHVNTGIIPVLQEGPKCGLVALCMAAQQLKDVGADVKTPSTDEIYDFAKNKGYTLQGEMFSATYMAQLAEELIGCRCSVLKGGMPQHRLEIIQHLVKGYPALVPYDADRNHEPICKRGHKAHWAVIPGLILGIDQWHGGLLDGYQQDNDPHCHDLYHALPDTTAPKLDWSRVHQAFLYARQGKSRRLALWKYELLHESNIQMVEMCPVRAQEIELYVLPDDGVEGGLSGRAVLLFPPR